MDRVWAGVLAGLTLWAAPMVCSAEAGRAKTPDPGSASDAALLNQDTLVRDRAAQDRNAAAKAAYDAETAAFKAKQDAYLADLAKSRAAELEYRRAMADYQAKRLEYELAVRGGVNAADASRRYMSEGAPAPGGRLADKTMPRVIPAPSVRQATVQLPAPGQSVQLDTRYFLCGDQVRLAYRLRDGGPLDEVQFAGQSSAVGATKTGFKTTARRSAEPLGCDGQTIAIGPRAAFEPQLVQARLPNGDEAWSTVEQWRHLLDSLSYVTYPAPWPRDYAGREAELARAEAQRLAERRALLEAQRAAK